MDGPYNARPTAQPIAEPRRSYFMRHWRGELSLARTFWLDGVALGLLFIALSMPLEMLLGDDSIDQATAGAIVLLLVGSSLALWTWQLVGLWRSARRHGPFAGVVVPLLIVAGVAHFAYPFAKGFAPAFTESFNAQYELSRQADSDADEQ